MPGKYNFTINQGTTLKRGFKFRDSSGPVNLDGAIITFEIAPVEVTQRFTYSIESGHISCLNPEEGRVTLKLSAQDTGSYVWQNARYNLNIHYANGDVERLLEGSIRVNRRI